MFSCHSVDCCCPLVVVLIIVVLIVVVLIVVVLIVVVIFLVVIFLVVNFHDCLGVDGGKYLSFLGHRLAPSLPENQE